MEGERQSVASGVDPSLYPVAVLIDELRHDDMAKRLNSVENLSKIAVALGEERCREELLPFLQEIIDDDDEVLIALAKQLPNGILWVGGPGFAHVLTGPLEELCSVEEVSVRDAAVLSLTKIVEQTPSEQVSRHFCGLVARMAAHDWFTSRISVCGIFASVIPRIDRVKQEELLKTYVRLCGDDTPMVRRQAANVLGNVAQAIGQGALLGEVFQAFEQLSKDEQDSVRILAISNCVALGRLCNNAQWQEKFLLVVKACAEDKSWRVRYTMAASVQQLLEVFQDKASTRILPLYMRLLADQEVEVRMIAAARIGAVAAFSPTKEFLETLVPAMEKLTRPREHSELVRASLAGSVLGLAPIFGAKLTAESLMNIFLQLIKDESPDVRLKVIGTLGEMSTVVGIDGLSQSLLPSIKELGKDGKWRVRLAVIECMPLLSQCLGEAKFTSEFGDLFTAWLIDSVFSVRDAATMTLRRLCEVLGEEWSEANVVPQLQALLSHRNYLCRISVLLCAAALSNVVTAAFLERHLVPIVQRMSSDPIPNVRFNSAKAIKAIQESPAGQGAARVLLVPCLQRLRGDEDRDVQFFARGAGAVGN